MKKKYYAFLLVLPLLALLAMPFNSCNAPKPSKCVITVRDSAGNKTLSGVKVELYANVTYNGTTTKADLQATGTTDSEGKVNFSFKNPCVMDIKATVPTCTVNAGQHKYCNGKGIVKMEEGKTAEKTVKIDQ